MLGPGATYPPNAKEDNPAREVPADVIVLANGFGTIRWLHPLKITGVGGKDLVQTMQDRGAQAYQDIALDSFPNFFIIFGPNIATGHSSVIMAIESKSSLVLQAHAAERTTTRSQPVVQHTTMLTLHHLQT